MLFVVKFCSFSRSFFKALWSCVCSKCCQNPPPDDTRPKDDDDARELSIIPSPPLSFSSSSSVPALEALLATSSSSSSSSHVLAGPCLIRTRSCPEALICGVDPLGTASVVTPILEDSLRQVLAVAGSAMVEAFLIDFARRSDFTQSRPK